VTYIAAKEPINRFALSNSLRAGIHLPTVEAYSNE